jgi:hypothetical protein
MSLFSALAGYLLHTASQSSLRLHRGASALAGTVNVVVGVWWAVVGGG